MKLTLEEKLVLLSIARNSIESIYKKETVEFPEIVKDNPVLESMSGAFVTLTKNNQLRGCIGYIIANEELYKTVSKAAVQAALHDPRFEELKESEVDKVKIEISVLSEPFPMNDYDEIEIGKHGVILEEPRRALLLPQVPVEHGLDRDQFLSALCDKAGLYSDYWKETKLKMSLFTANVFSEEELEEK